MQPLWMAYSMRGRAEIHRPRQVPSVAVLAESQSGLVTLGGTSSTCRRRAMETVGLVLVLFVAAPLSFWAEARRRRGAAARGAPATRPYTWGLFQGLLGVLIGAVGALLFLAGVWFANGDVVLAGVLLVVGYGLSGYYVMLRRRWAWVVLTILQFNPIFWIIDYIYGRNRWEEFARQEKAARMPGAPVRSSANRTGSIRANTDHSQAEHATTAGVITELADGHARAQSPGKRRARIGLAGVIVASSVLLVVGVVRVVANRRDRSSGARRAWWVAGRPQHGDRGGTRAGLAPQAIARRAMASVLALTMRDANGQPYALGTGFVVAHHVVATNAHVLAGATTGSATPLGDSSLLPIQAVLAVDLSHDVALVSVPTEQPALPLATAHSLTIGDGLYAIGNPMGLSGTFSTGILSAIRPIGNDTILQVTTPLSHGSSGGPVLDTDGDVIGVATATYRQGQNLNFAVPASYIARLLGGPHASAPLSSIALVRNRHEAWSGTGAPAVVAENFEWNDQMDLDGDYTFSLRNRSGDDVQNIQCLVVFYDNAGRPIEADPVSYSSAIPAGLARRVSSSVDPSVKRLTTSRDEYSKLYSFRPRTRLEFRMLNYDVR